MSHRDHYRRRPQSSSFAGADRDRLTAVEAETHALSTRLEGVVTAMESGFKSVSESQERTNEQLRQMAEKQAERAQVDWRLVTACIALVFTGSGLLATVLGGYFTLAMRPTAEGVATNRERAAAIEGQLGDALVEFRGWAEQRHEWMRTADARDAALNERTKALERAVFQSDGGR